MNLSLTCFKERFYATEEVVGLNAPYGPADRYKLVKDYS